MDGQFLVRQIYDDEITYNLIGAAVEILSEFYFICKSFFEKLIENSILTLSIILYKLLNKSQRLRIIFTHKINILEEEIRMII